MFELTVQELIDQLEAIENPQAKVRFASQPNWPFEYSINPELIGDEESEVVYLSENSQIGYLPGEIKEELNW